MLPRGGGTGQKILKLCLRNICRDVSTGATGKTAVAPKFSDTLTFLNMDGPEIGSHL